MKIEDGDPTRFYYCRFKQCSPGGQSAAYYRGHGIYYKLVRHVPVPLTPEEEIRYCGCGVCKILAEFNRRGMEG